MVRCPALMQGAASQSPKSSEISRVQTIDPPPQIVAIIARPRGHLWAEKMHAHLA